MVTITLSGKATLDSRVTFPSCHKVLPLPHARQARPSPLDGSGSKPRWLLWDESRFEDPHKQTSEYLTPLRDQFPSLGLPFEDFTPE